MPPDLLLQSLPTAACTQHGGSASAPQKELSPPETNPGPQASPDEETGWGAQGLPEAAAPGLRTQTVDLSLCLSPRHCLVLFPKTNPHMLSCLIPTHPRGHSHACAQDKDAGAQSSRGPNPRSPSHQDARGLKSFQSSNPRHPFHEPKLPPSPSSTQERGGEGERARRGGGRGGGEPPTPAAGSFLVRGKASNEGPADAAELAVPAWEPCGAAGRASLLPISTQVLHQSARLLPGAEARGTALLTVGGGHGALAGPGPCPLPFWGECKPPNPLTHSHPLQSAGSGQTPSPRGRTNEDGRH